MGDFVGEKGILAGILIMLHKGTEEYWKRKPKATKILKHAS